MDWRERERLLTPKDKEAISVAKKLDWTEIDEDSAESDSGKYEVHSIIMRKYHQEEHRSQML